MKVGIIIGTYNNSLHVHDTLASIRVQQYSNWICIIIDNGSTDDTALKIQQDIKGDNRFQFYRKDNNGPSAGRNFGYKHLPPEIEYVHFLDGDDMLNPAFLEVMVSYLEKNAEVGLVGCQFEMIDEVGRYVGDGTRSRYAPKTLGLPGPLASDVFNTPFETFFSATGQGPFALFRNKVYRNTTGYEETFWSHEDSDIFCQMSLLASVHYLPNRLYIKRGHSHNLTNTSNSNYSKFRDKWDFYISDKPDENKRVTKALQYYYGYHMPLRHFKVAVLAAKDFLKNPKKGSFKWIFECLGNGIADLFFKRELRRRVKRRSAKLQSH